MFWIALAIIGAVVVFIATGISSSRIEKTDLAGNVRYINTGKWKLSKKSLLAILPLFLVIGGCIATVPAGHTGVLVTFGKVESNILSEGVSMKLPYQEVILVDNRVQKMSFQMEAFSADIQQTSINGSINFMIDKTQSQNLYRNVGTAYFDTIILPRIQEDVKLVFSRYTAEELIGMRTVLSAEVLQLIEVAMQRYGIQIASINLEDIDFTDTFTDAVEAKQVAQQRKLTTQTEQESALIIAETEAKKRVIAAQAEAETAMISADAAAYAVEVAAKAEAEANKIVAQSLTSELIEYTKVQNWDGAVPMFQSGQGEGGVYPVINLEQGQGSAGNEGDVSRAEGSGE
ncbi:MAG: prohibitin family protein [Christensenellales bacterium]|jgi:prohibitin 2